MPSIPWLGVAGLLVALAASATGPFDHPADPAAAAPPLRYRSAFDGYRPFGDTAVGNWRAINERVRDAAAEAGGHAHHGATPAPAQPAPAPPNPAAADGAKR